MYRLTEIKTDLCTDKVEDVTSKECQSLEEVVKNTRDRLCDITWDFYENGSLDKEERADMIDGAMGLGFADDAWKCIIAKHPEEIDMRNGIVAVLDETYYPCGDYEYTFKCEKI